MGPDALEAFPVGTRVKRGKERGEVYFNGGEDMYFVKVRWDCGTESGLIDPDELQPDVRCLVGAGRRTVASGEAPCQKKKMNTGSA